MSATNKSIQPNAKRSISTGYITVPIGVDRDSFVEKCLRTEKVSVQVEGGGGVLKNCFITKSCLKDIEFPLEPGGLGSGVAFFTDVFTTKAIVVGIVGKNGETNFEREQVVSFRRTKGGNYALLSVDGNGMVNVDIIGNKKGGSFNVRVRDENNESKINFSVKGQFSVESEGDNISFKTDKDITLSPGNKLKVGEANEAMVRGDELKKEIDKTNDVVKQIKKALLNFIPATGDGGAALKTLATSLIGDKEVGDFENIRSEQSFLE